MKQHILFIHPSKDELELFLDALKEMSHEDGVKCTYASSCEHAVNMLRHLVPDFIFYSVEMSSMTALEFTQFIRDEPRFRKVQVYLYSNDIGEDEYSMLIKAGANGWMQKAENSQRLRIKLEMFIGSRFQKAWSHHIDQGY